MKKILLIVLFITGVCFGQTISPCEDERYIVLKNKSLDDMSDREYEYFIRKDKECSEYKILNLEKVNQETAPTNKQESVSLRETTKSQGIAISFNPNGGFSSFIFLTGGSASMFDPTFYYVFNNGNFSVEPAVGFTSINQDGEYGSSKMSIMTFGLGLLQQKSDSTGLSTYYGFRIAKTTISQEDNYDYDGYSDSDSDSESFISLAPVYGLEYYVNKHFSISGELQLNYFKPEDDDDDITQTEIMSKLFFRFYFK